MYLGKIVEIDTTDRIFVDPGHPYTRALLSAIPKEAGKPSATQSDGQRIRLEGDVPSPLDPPSGCRFRTRCWLAQEICAVEEPELADRCGTGQLTACHFACNEKLSV
jgi:oligopeptide transport system ATP-binding protein